MLVQIQLTERCNLNCTYCFEGEKSLVTMDGDFAKRVIDFVHGSYQSYLVELPKPEDLVLVFYGGEPFLVFDLIKELFHYSESKATIYAHSTVRYALITNGYGLTPEIMDFLSEHRDKVRIKVSLDGNQPTNDAHRRNLANEGTFERVFANAKKLQEEVDSVQIAMVIMPDQVENLYDNVRFFTESGFSKIEFEVAATTEWRQEDFDKLEDQVDRLIDYYLEQLQKDPEYKLVALDNWLRPLLVESNPVVRCGAGRNSFFINTEGKIYTCPYGNKFDECCFGDVEQGFTDNVHLISRLDLQKFPIECQECANYDKCTFTCVAQNMLFCGSPYEVSPINCAKGRLSLKYGMKFGNSLYREMPEVFQKKFQQKD